MDWGANFWVWMATEVFFGIFVAVLLYYFFVRKDKASRKHDPKNRKPL